MSNTCSNADKQRIDVLLTLALTVITVTLLTGCGGSGGSTPSSPTSNPPSRAETRPEFISLTEPVTVEYATLQVGNRQYTLTQSDFSEIDDAMATFMFEDNVIVEEAGGEGEPTAAIIFGENTIQLLINDESTIREVDIENVSEQASQVLTDGFVLTIEGSMSGIGVRLVYPSSMEGMGTSAITIDEASSSIYLSGTLGARTYNQLFELTQQHPELTELHLINVGGSINDEVNMQTGRLVRNAGLTTIIPTGSTVASGGVDLFCAGLQRFIEPSSALLVHSWGGIVNGELVSAHELPVDHPGHVQQIAYFSEMLGQTDGPDFYWFTIYSAPFGAELHRMTDQEILLYGLETSISQ